MGQALNRLVEERKKSNLPMVRGEGNGKEKPTLPFRFRHKHEGTQLPPSQVQQWGRWS